MLGHFCVDKSFDFLIRKFRDIGKVGVETWKLGWNITLEGSSGAYCEDDRETRRFKDPRLRKIPLGPRYLSSYFFDTNY